MESCATWSLWLCRVRVPRAVSFSDVIYTSAVQFIALSSQSRYYTRLSFFMGAYKATDSGFEKAYIVHIYIDFSAEFVWAQKIWMSLKVTTFCFISPSSCSMNRNKYRNKFVDISPIYPECDSRFMRSNKSFFGNFVMIIVRCRLNAFAASTYARTYLHVSLFTAWQNFTVFEFIHSFAANRS